MAKIVYIEDEVALREDVVEEFRDAGHEVLEAGDGQEGLHIILQEKPDLVVSDISMPGMSGLDLLQTVREEHPNLADLPFIFLSALADRSDVIRGRQLGADDYLTKTVEYDLLLATVDSRLAQVERTNAKKEREMVMLYKKLTSMGKAIVIEELPEGRFHALNLDEIKKQYPDLWENVASRVDQVAVRIIKSHIGPSDIFIRRGNGAYLMCFPSLGDTEAHYKADSVRMEILEKFIGTVD